jgi:hypothetical protein
MNTKCKFFSIRNLYNFLYFHLIHTFLLFVILSFFSQCKTVELKEIDPDDELEEQLKADPDVLQDTKLKSKQLENMNYCLLI